MRHHAAASFTATGHGYQVNAIAAAAAITAASITAELLQVPLKSSNMGKGAVQNLMLQQVLLQLLLQHRLLLVCWGAGLAAAPAADNLMGMLPYVIRAAPALQVRQEAEATQHAIGA